MADDGATDDPDLPDTPPPAPSGVDTSSLDRATYVALTTFRRSGEGVTTPVWNVRHREGWACTTDPSSGKVRRIRRDPRVEVAPCDARGRTAPGAPRFTGTARVVAGGEHEEVRAAIRRRHRILGPLLGLRDSLQRLLGRPVGECAVTWTVEG